MYKADILAYLIALDKSLPEGSADLHVDVRMAGGAALAFYWDNRGTRDIDVAYPTDLPDDILDAAFYIADEYGLPLDWINTDVAVRARPPEKMFTKDIHEGKRLNISVPDKKTLLGMKLYAGRDKDLDDAIKLAKEVGVHTFESAVSLLKDCYTEDLVEYIKSENGQFIDRVLRFAL